MAHLSWDPSSCAGDPDHNQHQPSSQKMSMHWPTNKQIFCSLPWPGEGDRPKKTGKSHDSLIVPEEAGVSICLVGAKFQEDLLPDLDATDQLFPLQEAHVTYYMNNMIVYH